MTDNPLFLPLIITLIFWAYREFCHLIDKGNWREERLRFQAGIMTRGDLIYPTNPTGASQVILPPDAAFRPPNEELTPAQLKEREVELNARLQRDRMAELEQEKFDKLTSESEAQFAEFIGSP